MTDFDVLKTNKKISNINTKIKKRKKSPHFTVYRSKTKINLERFRMLRGNKKKTASKKKWLFFVSKESSISYKSGEIEPVRHNGGITL